MTSLSKQAKEKQQELRELEANNEVKVEEKHADVRVAEDILNMQKTEADKKRKQAQDQAQAIGNPNLLEDEAEGEFRMEVEQDNPEVRQRRLWAPKPKAKATQVGQQSYDASELRPQHVTNKKDRAERAKEREERKAQMQLQPSTRTRLTKTRAQLAGAPPEDLREVCAWLHMAPRRKSMLSASLRRVRERRRHGDESRHAQGEAKEFQPHASFQRHILQK